MLLRDTLVESGFDRDSYFSLLRPITELAIAQRFSELTGYHRAFTSCNRAYVRDPARRVARWCGECAKCAFVGLILSPFIERDELTEILGFDVLTSAAITTYLDGLVGLDRRQTARMRRRGRRGGDRPAADRRPPRARTCPSYPRQRPRPSCIERGLMPSAERQREVFELRSLDSIPPAYRGLLPA